MIRRLKRLVCIAIGHRFRFYVDEHFNFGLRCRRCGLTKPLNSKGSLFE